MESDRQSPDRQNHTTPPKKKKRKKRSKFQRRLRALSKYIKTLPAQTLAVIGGGLVLVIAAIVLLVIFLPKGNETVKEPEQLTITDVPTPTPTLPPISTPEPTQVPTPTPGVVLDEPLKLQDVNDVVAKVQERLVELGYMQMPEGGYTTKYGPATKNGVRRFQMCNYESHKEWDGICGQRTFDLMFSEEAKGFHMKKGDTDNSLYDGELVTKLQTRLSELGYYAEKVNATYDENTVNAVKGFQTDNNLVADGQAGPDTLALLYGTTVVDAATAQARNAAAEGTAPDATGEDVAPAASPDQPAASPEQPSVTAEPNPVAG